MNVVANIDYTFSGTDTKTKRNDILNEYSDRYLVDKKSTIYRNGLGDVSVDKKQIHRDLAYLNSDGEMIAMLAVPEVIKNGKQILITDNHKKRGYDTITIAAPVSIKGVRGDMAVVIKNTDRFKYKMHRVLMPDGSVFKFKDKENSSYNIGTVNHEANGSPNITTVSNNISQNPLTVNTNNDKMSGSDDIQRRVKDSEEIRIDEPDIKNIQSIGRKSINDFTSSEIGMTENFARKYFEEMGVKSPFFRAWFGDWRVNDQTPVETITLLNNSQSERGTVENIDTTMQIGVSKIGIDHIKSHHHNSEFAQYIIKNLSEITQKAVLLDSFVSEPTGGTKHKNTAIMHSFYIPVKFNGEKIVVKLFVEEFYNDWNDSIQRRDYDLTKIEVLDDADRFGENNSAPLYASKNTSVKSISDLFQFVKQNDKDFNPKPASKIVNEDGTPKEVYHGTSKENGDFYVFDYSKAKKRVGGGFKLLGKGMYFAANKFKEDSRFSDRVIKAYVNIKNPYISKGSLRSSLKNDLGIVTDGLSYDEIQQIMKDMKYDGVISDNGNIIVVFDSNQIKSATDNIGTFNKDNDDIRYRLKDTDSDLSSSDLQNGDEYDIMDSQKMDGEVNESGLGQENEGIELGRNRNLGETERYAGVGVLEHIQQRKQYTPDTKRIHRSGVSAEALTPSELTAEQATLRTQYEIDGWETEFYTKAKYNNEEQTGVFNTKNTMYFPDNGFDRNDIVINNGVASFTEKRFNDLIEEFSVPIGGQLNQNYAKGYVAYISPSDFLSLTTLDERLIVEDVKTNQNYGNGKLDVNILSKNAQTPFLEIDFEDGTVEAHEGRHRMVMLRDAGIEKVAIVVMDIDSERNKYKTEKMTNITVTGQKFTRGTATGRVTFDEIIPLSPNYRTEVRNKFVDNQSDISYRLKDQPELEPQSKLEEIARTIGTNEELAEVIRQNKTEIVKLIKSNESLQKRLENAQRQMTISKAPQINKIAAGKLVKSLINEMQGTVNVKETGERIISIYNEFFFDTKKAGRVSAKLEAAAEKMMNGFTDVATDIVESASMMSVSEDYVALRTWLKETDILFPEDAKSDVHFGEFRKANMGTFNLSNDGL